MKLKGEVSSPPDAPVLLLPLPDPDSPRPLQMINDPSRSTASLRPEIKNISPTLLSSSAARRSYIGDMRGSSFACAWMRMTTSWHISRRYTSL